MPFRLRQKWPTVPHRRHISTTNLIKRSGRRWTATRVRTFLQPGRTASCSLTQKVEAWRTACKVVPWNASRGAFTVHQKRCTHITKTRPRPHHKARQRRGGLAGQWRTHPRCSFFRSGVASRALMREPRAARGVHALCGFVACMLGPLASTSVTPPRRSSESKKAFWSGPQDS